VNTAAATKATTSTAIVRHDSKRPGTHREGYRSLDLTRGVVPRPPVPRSTSHARKRRFFPNGPAAVFSDPPRVNQRRDSSRCTATRFSVEAGGAQASLHGRRPLGKPLLPLRPALRRTATWPLLRRPRNARLLRIGPVALPERGCEWRSASIGRSTPSSIGRRARALPH
jgi:hypothetical protein